MNGSTPGGVYRIMSECDRIAKLLSLRAGDDIGPAEDVRNHLSVCQSCRDERQKYLQVISAARLAGKREFQLSAASRARIVAIAVERASRPRWSLWWRPVTGLSLRLGVTAVVAGCLLALLVLPVMRLGQTRSARETEVSPRIEVVSDGGVVKLAWTDGQRATYTVFKSPDPRGSARGERHIVRGNAWVDTQPDTSPIVFYRIE
jgi:hypothetical protein